MIVSPKCLGFSLKSRSRWKVVTDSSIIVMCVRVEFQFSGHVECVECVDSVCTECED